VITTGSASRKSISALSLLFALDSSLSAAVDAKHPLSSVRQELEFRPKTEHTPALGSDIRITAASPDDIQGFFDFFPEWVPRGVIDEHPINGQAGESVAISGDTVAIGVPAALNDAGRVEIWHRDGSIWFLEWTLDNFMSGSRFGESLDLSGDRLIVGAPGYDLSQFSTDVGRVYIFHRSGTTWESTAILDMQFNTNGQPRFGQSVAISGNTAVAGAPFALDGPDADGYAAFYRWDGFSWNLLVGAVGIDDGEQFGAAVDIVDRSSFGGDLEDYAVIGSPGRDLPDEGVFVAGGADVLRITIDGEVEWWQTLPFPDPGTFNAFGAAVTVTSPLFGPARIAIGAPGRDLHGKVLTYVRDGGFWEVEQELSPVDGEAFDRFGGAIALSGDRLIVGADGDDIEGDGGEIAEAGSVYFFHNLSGLWFRNDREQLRSLGGGDRFGRAVAISGIHAVAGSGFVDGGGGSETGLVVEYIVDTILRNGFD